VEISEAGVWFMATWFRWQIQSCDESVSRQIFARIERRFLSQMMLNYESHKGIYKTNTSNETHWLNATTSHVKLIIDAVVHRRQSWEVWWVTAPYILRLVSWCVHEILLYPIMYRNLRWEHFPKWWLSRNREICVY